MSSITVRKDLRDRFGPARDQGARPTCLIFAASDSHASTRAPWEELCCEYLLYASKQYDNTPPQNGARMSSICHVLENVGQPIETDWPYLKVLPSNIKLWKPPKTIGTLFQHSTQPTGNGFQHAWDAVMADSPALIGMTTSPAFHKCKAQGVVDADEPVVPERRHAVIGVAVGDRKGVRYLLVRNSWGAKWGQAGYAWLSERYATPRLKIVVTLH